MADEKDKPAIRNMLRAKLEAMSEESRQIKSSAAASLLSGSPEFQAARVVMLYLSTPMEMDTAGLALRCWQAGKTVVVPKVSWNQRRMMPVEITSLQTTMTTSPAGVPEPVSGKPVPLDMIDMAIVPGLGFSLDGHRLGRGMGFYDRFLAQTDFGGVSCGFAFDEQIVATLPMLDHDIPLGMLCTDRGIFRFTAHGIAPR